MAAGRGVIRGERAAAAAAMRAYQDTEWGGPSHDEAHLFEMLVLEGAQAGLSWSTILAKRDNYRRAFDGFDPTVIARYGDDRLELLRQDAGIVRNRLKIRSVVTNARAFLEVQRQHGSFDAYLWGMVDGRVIVNHPKAGDPIPAHTEVSDRISRQLKSVGFTFVGSTIVYAFLQSVG